MIDLKKLLTMLADPSSTVDLVYPVGSIYMSVSETSPAVLFGGTWEQIQDKFLLASGTGHAAGTTGGAETVKLTASQMPAHTHTGPLHSHSLGNHTHVIPAHTHTASTASAGAHTHTLHRWEAAAEGSARYAAQGADSTPTYNTSSAGAHTHAVTVAQKAAFNTQAATGTTGSAGTGNTGSAGGGTAHNNMPPYLSVYVWKRTA